MTRSAPRRTVIRVISMPVTRRRAGLPRSTRGSIASHVSALLTGRRRTEFLLGKLTNFREPNGEPTEADAGRRRATFSDSQSS